jgi:hypothetical protein
MNENNSITITFKVQLDEVTQIIESVLPYNADFETLEKIVSEANLSLYRLGWTSETVDQAIEKVIL